MKTDHITRRIIILGSVLMILVHPATGSSRRIIEGDIVIENNGAARQSPILQSPTWPSGLVPFVIDKTLFSDKDALESISKAMRYIQGNTSNCVRFFPRTTSNTDYIIITAAEPGCFGSVGRIGGAQIVNIGTGCTTIGIIMHELVHALGFWHEQSRIDRDDYVKIYFENVMIDSKGEFKIHEETTEVVKNVPYDFYSILHYKYNQFSKSRFLDTIVPNDDHADVPKKVLGQRIRLSDKDTQKIMWLYKCEASYCAPPDYQNVIASPSKNRYALGDVVILYCSRGELIGPKRSTCLPGGKWAGATPLCIDPKETFIYCDMDELCLKSWKWAYWRRNNGTTVTIGNGPGIDHTYQTATGSYFWVDLLDGFTGHIAIALTPPLPLMTKNEPASLMFYYYMYGLNLQSSKVSIYYYGMRVWTQVGTTDEPKWYKMVVDKLYYKNYPAPLVFIVETGTMGAQSSIAIDDVFIGRSSIIQKYDQTSTDAQINTKPGEYDYAP